MIQSKLGEEYKEGNNQKRRLLDNEIDLIVNTFRNKEYKEGNNQKRRLLDNEIDLIVNTFRNKEVVEDFSVAVSYDEIKEKGYSLSAGQYFDIKILFLLDNISTSR